MTAPSEREALLRAITDIDDLTVHGDVVRWSDVATIQDAMRRALDALPASAEPSGRRPAYYTYDSAHGGAYYFAPIIRAAPPYREQRHATAILDIGSDGTLAGVELVIGPLPPPPAQPPSEGEGGE